MGRRSGRAPRAAPADLLTEVIVQRAMDSLHTMFTGTQRPATGSHPANGSNVTDNRHQEAAEAFQDMEIGGTGADISMALVEDNELLNLRRQLKEADSRVHGLLEEVRAAQNVKAEIREQLRESFQKETVRYCL